MRDTVAPAIPHRVLYAAVTVLLCSLPQYAGLLGVYRDRLQEYLGINLAQYGVLLSAGYLPGALGALGAGLWLQRQRPRVVVGLAMAGTGLGCALAAVSGRRYLLLLAGLAVICLASRGLWIALQSYLVRLFPEARRRAVTFALMMTAAVAIVTPLGMEYLLRLGDRPGGPSFGAILHVPFAVLAVVLLAGAVLYRRPLGLGTTAEDHEPGGPAPSWTAPRPWLLVGMLVAHGSADVVAWLWLPRVLASESYPVMMVGPGVVLAVYNIGYVVSRLLLLLVPEGRGRSGLLILPGLCGGSLFVAGVLTRDFRLTVAGYLLGGFCWSLEAPAAASELAHAAGRRFGTLLACNEVGAAVGAGLVGMLMGWWGNHLPADQLWRLLLVPGFGFVTVGLLGIACWWSRGAGSAGAPSTGSGPDGSPSTRPD